MKKIVKISSHLLKKMQHQKGNAFAVLGYPRSGTTMLSEIVSMVTPYYFDRDNIFATSGYSVLHSHWAPRKFLNKNSVYIVRNPYNVSISIEAFLMERRLPKSTTSPLRNRHVCSLNWCEHVSQALESNKPIIQYEKLVEHDPESIQLLSEITGAHKKWISLAIEILGEKHQFSKHPKDVGLADRKREIMHEIERDWCVELERTIDKEISFYQKAFGKEP